MATKLNNKPLTGFPPPSEVGGTNSASKVPARSGPTNLPQKKDEKDYWIDDADGNPVAHVLYETAWVIAKDGRTVGIPLKKFLENYKENYKQGIMPVVPAQTPPENSQGKQEPVTKMYNHSLPLTPKLNATPPKAKPHSKTKGVTKIPVAKDSGLKARGRPKSEVAPEEIQQLAGRGFSSRKIAQIFESKGKQVSYRTICRALQPSLIGDRSQ